MITAPGARNKEKLLHSISTTMETFLVNVCANSNDGLPVWSPTISLHLPQPTGTKLPQPEQQSWWLKYQGFLDQLIYRSWSQPAPPPEAFPRPSANMPPSSYSPTFTMAPILYTTALPSVANHFHICQHYHIPTSETNPEENCHFFC